MLERGYRVPFRSEEERAQFIIDNDVKYYTVYEYTDEIVQEE